ncbi:capsid triplex protein 1 [Silurid herpesvirus 1]|nr:capsid triplex protein 1 [Silurid herpesvirus 1]
MMISNVGLTKNACFPDGDFKPGRLMVRFEPLVEPNPVDQGPEVVNLNFLTGSERLLQLMFAGRTNLQHKYTTLKEFVSKWSAFKARFQREIVGRNVRKEVLTRPEILQALLDIAQERTGMNTGGVYPAEVTWFFAQLILGDVETFTRAIKPAGLLTTVTENPSITTGTIVAGSQNDLYDLVDDTGYINDTHLRKDRSCEGKSIFMIVTPTQDPPRTLERFRGVDVKVIITDSSLHQVVRQVAATVSVDHPRYAIAYLGRCFSRTLMYTGFGDWKIYDARAFSDSMDKVYGAAGEEPVTRPAPLKRIRLLI